MLVALGEDPGLYEAIKGRTALDAVVGMQIFWKRRSRMARQISRSGDRKHPELVRDAQDRHVALDPVPDTNSGIEPAADNVAVRVIDMDFKVNGRVFREKWLDEWREHHWGQYRGGRP